MKAVFLDALSMGNDLDFSQLEHTVDSLTCYDYSETQDIIPRLREADIAIVNKAIVDEDVMSRCPNLKLITVTATGTNNIDLDAAKQRNIRVCNAIRYGRSALVQHNFALLLSLASNLFNYIADVRNGKWASAQQFCLMDHPIMELEGKTIGIIGYGDLGQGMADMAKAFGMKVLIASRNEQQASENEGDNERVPLKSLLPQVDVLSIHCLLSSSTENLITATELALMKPSAFLLNTARGGIVNEQDLLAAIENRVIAGAGVDVLSEEPPKQGNPLLTVELPNLLITPHCAWASREARQRILDITSNSIEQFKRNSLQRWVV
ncbi:MAG: D-2-hydroxyacid dehydrogenase [Pseudomonadales bacterium]|nr:D-2-hydroxyacid dehydrogenase [Pseudomonadales bacterium]